MIPPRDMKIATPFAEWGGVNLAIVEAEFRGEPRTFIARLNEDPATGAIIEELLLMVVRPDDFPRATSGWDDPDADTIESTPAVTVKEP